MTTVPTKSNSRCIRCMKNSDEVKLLDALKDSRPVMICEYCSRYEDAIIIRKPTSKQLSSPNKHLSVYQRLQKMAGLEENSGKNSDRPDVYELMNKKHELQERMLSEYSIKKRKEIEKKLNKPTRMIEHYNWIVQRERRKKGLTLRNLSVLIGEPEMTLKMFEEGTLTDDSRRIAEKMEQFLKLRLLKTPEESEKDEETLRMDEARKNARMRAGLGLPEDSKEKKEPARLISFNPEKLRHLTIADLAEMKKKMRAKELPDSDEVIPETTNHKTTEMTEPSTNNNAEEPWEYKGQVVFFETE